MGSHAIKYHIDSQYTQQNLCNAGKPDWEHQPVPFAFLTNEAEALDLQPYLSFLEDKVSCPEVIPDVPPSMGYSSLQRLAYILYFSSGIVRVNHTGKGPVYLRANHSSGGLYPNEIYFALRNWEGLYDGIYCFHPLLCSVILVQKDCDWGALSSLFFNHSSIAQSDLVLLVSGIFKRSTWRFKHHSYRRMLLDSGALLSNILAQREYHDLKMSLLLGFNDAAVKLFFHLPTPDEVPLAAVAIRADDSAPDELDMIAGMHPAPHLALPMHPALDQHPHMQQYFRECIAHPSACRSIQQPLHFDDDIRYLERPIPGCWVTILHTIRHRRHCRQFQLNSLTEQEISNWLGSGWELCAPFMPHDLLLNIRIIVPGHLCFQYRGNEHCIIPQNYNIPNVEAYSNLCLGDETVTKAGALVLISSALEETIDCFGERGYRYALMQAGILAGALNLSAQFYSLGFAGYSGFFDQQASELFGVPKEEYPLYICAVGKTKD
jgi:SagB-type dehydrogenase family enzyme